MIVVHRTDGRVRDVDPELVIESVFPIAFWIWDPTITAAAQQADPKYWLIVGDSVSLMNPAQRAAVDDAELGVARDSLADSIDRPESYDRAFALLLLDQANATSAKINEILIAIETATSLAEVRASIAAIEDAPTRTPAQLKQALRARLET